MCDREVGRCDICLTDGVAISRKYYDYRIDCECCIGSVHFEVVRYCKECEPLPPERIHVVLQGDEYLVG